MHLIVSDVKVAGLEIRGKNFWRKTECSLSSISDFQKKGDDGDHRCPNLKTSERGLTAATP